MFILFLSSPQSCCVLHELKWKAFERFLFYLSVSFISMWATQHSTHMPAWPTQLIPYLSTTKLNLPHAWTQTDEGLSTTLLQIQDFSYNVSHCSCKIFSYYHAPDHISLSDLHISIRKSKYCVAMLKLHMQSFKFPEILKEMATSTSALEGVNVVSMKQKSTWI